jgi:class 3 adenylate cyclase
MIDPPETQWARTADGSHIAYQVVGKGPIDLLLMSYGSGNNMELAWDVAAFARVFRRLASFSRLIRFDFRGEGLSDPRTLAGRPSIEERAEDLLAVLDSADCERAAIVANGTAGLAAIFFAATYPNRTASLVLDGCYARLVSAPDYPCGIKRELIERMITRTEKATVGDDVTERGLRYIAPHATEDAEFVAQWRRYIRFGQHPGTIRAESEMLAFGDVRALLPSVQTPTLVLYRKDDGFAGRPFAQYLAEHIAEATLVEVPGGDNLMFIGDPDVDLDEIQEFLTGSRDAPVSDRVLATVLFTDIVGSTERAAELGDGSWRELLDSHDRTVRRQLERFRGREVSTSGDSFLATFDGPGRAIECACAIRDAVPALGLEIRAGLHTGEIEVRGNDVAGMAVHLGARVAALAGPSEVLVSSTVKDLVVGSGVSFRDAGEHHLKGVPGTWRLYIVTS